MATVEVQMNIEALRVDQEFPPQENSITVPFPVDNNSALFFIM
jgi:hypothetical protein